MASPSLVELHCHILPGIATICATPHIRHDHDVRIHELEVRVAALNHELVAREVPVHFRSFSNARDALEAAGLDPDAAS